MKDDTISSVWMSAASRIPDRPLSLTTPFILERPSVFGFYRPSCVPFDLLLTSPIEMLTYRRILERRMANIGIEICANFNGMLSY